MMKRHIAVVGLGFGDEGKGGVVDWLCTTRSVGAVIRFNGGAQAGHNVVRSNGQHHTFSQWGSGTFSRIPTWLSRFMIIEPFSMIQEAMHLKEVGISDPWALLNIDKDALIATPFHKAVGRGRELARGADRHGSVGMGIGEAVSHSQTSPYNVLRFGDVVKGGFTLRDKLHSQRSWAEITLAGLGWLPEPGDGIQLPSVETIAATYENVAKRIRMVGTKDWYQLLHGERFCVFEGAQGVLLDEWYGFHPYTTWSTTTFANADELADREVHRLGVVRSYTTRHGPGPFPTEDEDLAVMLREPHNGTGQWQGDFRVGDFDAVAHRYAIRVCGGVDALLLTHAERVRIPGICTGYKFDDEENSVRNIEAAPCRDLVTREKLTQRLMHVKPVLGPFEGDGTRQIEEQLGVPVAVRSLGPTAEEKWGCLPW